MKYSNTHSTPTPSYSHNQMGFFGSSNTTLRPGHRFLPGGSCHHGTGYPYASYSNNQSGGPAVMAILNTSLNTSPNTSRSSPDSVQSQSVQVPVQVPVSPSPSPTTQVVTYTVPPRPQRAVPQHDRVPSRGSLTLSGVSAQRFTPRSCAS